MENVTNLLHYKNFKKDLEFKPKRCGIFVSKTHPYLAASPDAIIDDDKLVEIKCPYIAKHYEISEDTVSYLKWVNDTLELDTS